MEQEKFKFKLFVPPRLRNTQVSAIKPQINTGDGGFFQNFNNGTEDDYNLPFGTKSTSKHIEVADPVSQKVKLVPEIDQENMETMNELYSTLYKEAEKIKRWKVTVEYELKEKERKLQENKKVIEALRKAIQELQFENEKLSLKLEDEIHENKDLLKQNNATRHLCNLLKEKCMQSMEKFNTYEHEREETRQMYVDLNNNIERMIQAFEELRVQSENSRLEMCFKLKEAAEKVAHLEKQHKREMHVMEKQVSALTVQNSEQDNKMKHINIQLQESREVIAELEEIRRQQDESLKKAESKQQSFLTELEETKSSLQRAENTCKCLETELQTAVKILNQVTEQKDATVEELKETRVLHGSVTEELQSKVSNMTKLLEKEEKRQKELRDESEILVLDLQKKSTELEMMARLKNDKEKQVEELARVLEGSIQVQKDLEHQLECVQLEKILLIKEKEIRNSDFNIQVQVQDLLDGKQILEKTIEKLQEREKQLNDTLQIREKEIHDLEMQLSAAFEDKQNCLQQLTMLKAELEKEILKNEQLSTDSKKLLLDKEHIITEKSNIVNELIKLQEALQNNRKIGEKAEKQIENLKETNIQLSNELECLKEKIKNKDEEAKNKLDETEDNVRNMESEISKKEKQLKTLENKINSLKKQIETKTKNIEELQQENKVLRKKVATENKQSSIIEGKVNKLENINKLHKEAIDSYKNEIEMARAAEEKLLKELETMKTVTNEALTMQKEIDIRCQHKISEMVTLMEKHKHQYDKTIEEKDTELEYYKTKEQELLSTTGSLERELSCKKNELSSLQEKMKTVINEKESLAREAKDDISKKEKKHKKIQTSFLETPEVNSLYSLTVHSKKSSSQNFTPINVNKLEYAKKSSWTPAKTYTVKTPPKSNLLRGSTNLLSEDGRKKKRKVLLEMDTRSDSSEKNDLLTYTVKTPPKSNLLRESTNLLSEDGRKKKRKVLLEMDTRSDSSEKDDLLHIRQLNITAATRKMQDMAWTAVSKIERRRKIKEAGQLFE